MKVNLNDKVRVQTTDMGRQIMLDLHGQFVKNWPLAAQEVIDYSLNKIPKADDERVEFLLWELMETFGSNMHNGLSVPISTEIEIVDKLRWTREKPKVPGFYWFKRDDGQFMGEAVEHDLETIKVSGFDPEGKYNPSVQLIGTGMPGDWEDDIGYWMGPIEVPDTKPWED